MQGVGVGWFPQVGAFQHLAGTAPDIGGEGRGVLVVTCFMILV